MTRSKLFTVLFTFIILAGFTPVAYAHYDQGTGRWLERDPLGVSPTVAPSPIRLGQLPDPIPQLQYSDGMNLYQYVNSDPISLRDPTGLQSSLQHPIGALHVLIAQWEAAGLVTHQIVARLAQMGVSAAVISQLTGDSVQAAQKAIDLVKLERDFTALAAGLTEAVKRTLRQTTCEAAKQMKNRWCGSRRGGNQPKSCTANKLPMPGPRGNGTRDCTEFIVRANHFRMCGLGRAAVLLLCPRENDPNRFGHLNEFFNMVQGEATCRARWAECQELNRQCWEKKLE
jgi:hypothetical protein